MVSLASELDTKQTLVGSYLESGFSFYHLPSYDGELITRLYRFTDDNKSIFLFIRIRLNNGKCVITDRFLAEVK